MLAVNTHYIIRILIALRYFIIEAVAWLVWYKLIRNKVAYKKIQLHFPLRKDYQREILYSLSTLFIFAAVPALVLFTPFRRYTQYYTDIHQHGMLYFWLAFPLILILHDAYFYWIHRLMHHPALFRVFHLLHHKSTNPSPWAALAFHPLEAVMETGILVILVMIIPTSQSHLISFFLFMVVYTVYGHLGWELYPAGFSRHPIGKWINTSVNHNLHHQYFKGNYGLYFTWWDQWMGTKRADSNEKFDEVTNRSSKKDTHIQAGKPKQEHTKVLEEIVG